TPGGSGSGKPRASLGRVRRQPRSAVLLDQPHDLGAKLLRPLRSARLQLQEGTPFAGELRRSEQRPGRVLVERDRVDLRVVGGGSEGGLLLAGDRREY